MLWYMIYNLVYAVIYDCDSMVLLDNFPFLISFVIKAKHLRTESVIGLRFSWSCIDLSLELRVLLLSKLYSLCSVYVCVWRRFSHFSNVFINFFFQIGAESNQAIMLVTDGVPYTYETIFQVQLDPEARIQSH